MKQSPDTVTPRKHDHSLSTARLLTLLVVLAAALEPWNHEKFCSVSAQSVSATHGARAAASCFPYPSSHHNKDAQGCSVMSWPAEQPPVSLYLSFQRGSTKGQAHLLLQSAPLWFGLRASKLRVGLACHDSIDLL